MLFDSDSGEDVFVPIHCSGLPRDRPLIQYDRFRGKIVLKGFE